MGGMKPVLIAAAVWLASCSQTAFDARGTVVFWSPQPDFTIGELATKIPGVKVVPSPVKDAWKALADGTQTPDLLVVDAGVRAETARAAGQLADLTSYLPKLAAPKIWWPSLGLPKDDAPLTVLPSSVYLWGLFYNPTVLKTAGIEPPRGWNALTAAFASLKKRGVVPVAVGAAFAWPALAWVSALDLRLNGADAHRALLAGTRRFDDAGMRKVYTTLIDWKTRGWFDPQAATRNWPEALAEVSSGRAGFVLLGAFGLSRVTDPAALAFLPLPDIGGVPQGDLASIQGFAVSARSKSIEAAVRLADASIAAGSPGQTAEAFRSSAVPGNGGSDFQKWQRGRLEHDRWVAPRMDQALPRPQALAVSTAAAQFFGAASPPTVDALALEFASPAIGSAP